MPRARTVVGLLAGPLVLVLAAGCGKTGGGKPSPQAISGKVTLNKHPLKDGSVTFVSSDGVLRSASIKDGSYKFPKDQGLLAGKYKVDIDSPDGQTPARDSTAPPGPGGNFASKNRIPPEWNEKSNHEIEVTSDGTNTFDFDIP